MVNSWVIGSIDEDYGVVVAMYCIEGEPYRFFEDEEGTISMIPLSAL